MTITVSYQILWGVCIYDWWMHMYRYACFVCVYDYHLGTNFNEMPQILET